MEINEITSKIIRAALTVHNELGPGLLESVYQECLCIELKEMGLNVKEEVLVPVIYKGREITQDGFRIDLLVEDVVVVELKSVEEVKPVHKKQLLTYLRLTGKTVGLLINFNANLLKEGIVRIVNKYESASQEKDRSIISRGGAEFAEKDEIKFYPQGCAGLPG